MAESAESVAKRRMSRRNCGNCGEPAARMILWAKQTIPICDGCDRLLETVRPKDLADEYDEDAVLVICHYAPDGRETSCGLDVDAGRSSWTNDPALVKGCSTCKDASVTKATSASGSIS